MIPVLVEHRLHPGSFDPIVLALAAATGATAGFALWVAEQPLFRVSPRARTAAWILVGAVAGACPAIAVGAFQKLAGPHAVLAAVTLVACTVAGASLGFVVSLPRRRRAIALAPRRVLSAVAATVAATAAALVAERVLAREIVLQSYPAIGWAIAVGVWVLSAEAGVWLSACLGEASRRRGPVLLAFGAWAAAVTSGLVAGARAPEARITPLLAPPFAGRLVALARRVTDFDRDGVSGWFAGGDCGPMNPNVHPRAREIPDNGLDDNCRWGDARRSVGAPTGPSPEGPPPVNVLLVTIDSLRADHVGASGYPRDTTPRLDAFASGARRFTRAYTSGGWTCLALQSMLSGLYARRLDWEPVAITTEYHILPLPFEARLNGTEEWMNMVSAPAHPPPVSLPDALRHRGMRTAAVVAAMPGSMLAHQGFLERSFDRAVVAPERGDARVTRLALEVLRELGSEPFFLWVHYFEPHAPYVEHEGIPSFGTSIVDQYDHEVAFTDRELGRLLDAASPGNGRETAIIVTADHGESFDGGFPIHGVDLHEDALHIPLIVRGPRAERGVCDAPASLVDVAPTILDWTATPEPSGLDGVSLLRAAPHRDVISDIFRHDRDGRVYIDQVGITGGERRIVYDRTDGSWLSYRAGTEVVRPVEPLKEPLDDTLVADLSNYLEGAGILE